MRVGFSGALTPSQLEQTGQSGVSDWTVSSAHAFLAGLEGALPPGTVAAARAAVWDAFFRQNLDALPAALPQALRDASGSLLTDLTAGDLLTLEDTLELLANGGAAVESGALPGQYRPGTGFYALDEEAQAALMAFFNVEASSGQRESSSAPYPSTSVPEGQRTGDAIE